MLGDGRMAALAIRARMDGDALVVEKHSIAVAVALAFEEKPDMPIPLP